MTNRVFSSPSCEAAKALVAHLQRVDMLLARAGMVRSERDATCQQIAEQFHDLLAVPVDQATPSQVEEALNGLADETAFASDDIQSRSQLLRMLWHRFWIGTPIPLALNDHGHKRILWGELIKLLGWIYLFILLFIMIIPNVMTGQWKFPNFMFTITFAIMFHLGFFFHILRTPVESLPRAEHWSFDRLHRYRFASLLIMGGSLVFVIAFFLIVYWLVAAFSGRGLWPVDHGLLSSVMLTLLWPICFGTLWLRRKRRLKFKRWADGSS